MIDETRPFRSLTLGVPREPWATTVFLLMSIQCSKFVQMLVTTAFRRFVGSEKLITDFARNPLNHLEASSCSFLARSMPFAHAVLRIILTVANRP